MKKIFNRLFVVVLMLVAFKTTTAYAANHQFSVRAYNCNKLNAQLKCVDDNNVVIDNPTQLTNNSEVYQGKVVQVDLYYEPGTDTDYGFQIGFNYDATKVDPVYIYDDDAEEDVFFYRIYKKTPANGGMWPAASAADPDTTNWSIQVNDAQADHQVVVLAMDTMLNRKLKTAGVVASLYFTIKSDATLGDYFNFEYDREYTKMNNESAITFSDLTLHMFKQSDTDPSLKGITVKHNGTNYLTNFNSTTKTYNVYVPYSVSNVEILGDPTKSSTVLTYSPTASGNVYGLSVSTTKKVEINTVAEDGTHTDKYTVNVYRLSNVNTLSSLSLSDISIGNFSSSTTTYTVANPVPYATGSTTITASPTSGKATLSPASGTSKTLNVGSNQIQVVVTPECAKSAYSGIQNNSGTACQTKTYTVNVTRTAPSTNNYLSSLTIDGSSAPSFNKTNNGPYNITVGYDTSKVTIAGVAEDTEHSVVSGHIGQQNVSVGDNTFTITVTPEDPDTAVRNYTVKVHRKSNNANLGSLTVTSDPQGTLSPSTFNAATTSYTYTVGPDVTAVTINATKANSNQTSISGTGVYNPQTTTKAEILVKAEDETKTKTYTVNLVRNKSTDVTLDELSVKDSVSGTAYTLSPSYSNSTNSYTVTVPSTATGVNVTATPHDSRTNATVSGKTTGLTTGDNTVTVTVVPENGETSKRTITITVKKQAANANLSNLTLDGISYGTFDSDTISYSKTVPYTTSSTKIAATLSDNKAIKTVKLNGNTISENTSVNLNVGDNVFTVEVKAEDRNVTKTYTVTITRTAPSTNNYLSSLTVNGTSVPSFNKTNNGPYNVTVGYDTNKVTIAATAEDTQFATISGDTGQKDASVGDNTYTVTVTPQDPNTQARTYTIKVHRKSNNANLGSLTVTSDPQGTLSPSTFNAATTSYTYTVGPDVTAVTINATKANSNQTSISGTGVYNPQTTTKAEILVKAEDETKTKTYTVNLVRNKSTDVTLDELSVAGYSISPDYSDSVNSYTVIVPSTTTSVNITATPHDSRTSAAISGKTTSLTTGDNVAYVTVTPEAGETAKRTITVTIKKLENNANLNSINLTNVSYTPDFSSGEISYTATVPYTTSSTKITAGLASNKATKAVTLNDNAINENTSVNLAVGANTFKVVVTPECAGSTYSTVPGNSGNACQSKTYTIVVNRAAASNDAYLTDLTIDGTTVSGFDGENTFSYNVTVGSNVSSINIGAVPNSTSQLATTSDTGSKNLTVGNNDFEIVVIAQNGETRVPYQLHVKKLSSDNELTGLTITSNPAGTQEPTSFNKQTTSYTYTVGPDVTAVTINATAPTGGTVTYSPEKTNNIYNPNETTSVTITVSPESCKSEYSGISNNTCTSKTYTVNLARIESSINTLSGIKVNDNDVPGFEAGKTSYSVDVPYNTPSVTVTATPADGDRESVTVTPPTTYGVGDNVYTIAVEAEDGTPNTYTVTVHRKNNDATLSGLTLDNATLNEDFDPDVTEYTATVPYITTTTNVNATTTDTSLDPDTNVVITGNTSLGVGENTITITVTPEDENEQSKTYTVVVTREAPSSNAYLTDLTIDNQTVSEFDGENIFEYSVEVSNSTSSIIIGATANTGSIISSDSDTGSKDLSVGNNDFTIVAVAQNGETRVPYTLHVKRLDNNSNLGSLTITSDPQGSLDKDFDPNETEYTYTVGPNAGDITVSADPEGSATVTISPDSPTGTYDPETTSAITITVTPEEGDPKVYTINVVRQPSTDNTLLSLGVQGYQISPDFSNDTPAYTLTVGKEVDKATIIAEKGESHQNIDGLGEKPLNKGENPFTVSVQSEDTTVAPRVFTITITREKSDIKTLDKIYINGEELEGFTPDNHEYTIDPVANDVSSINITADKTDPLSDVDGTGDVALNAGDNDITISVYPENGGEPEVYTIHVYRALNDNNYLATLTVNGVAVEGFNKENTEYSVNVPIDATTVSIDGTPEVQTSVVAGTGSAINLNADGTPTVIPISVIPEKGINYARTYNVTVNKVDDAEFITSVNYGHTIADGMIKTVARQTTSNGLKDQLDNDNAKLFNYKLVGTEEVLLEDTEYAGTGVIVKLISNGTLKDSKIVIVKGDTNGDGNITLFDAIKIFSHLIDSEHLEGAYAEAADVDSSGSITLFDAIQIFQILLQ